MGLWYLIDALAEKFHTSVQKFTALMLNFKVLLDPKIPCHSKQMILIVPVHIFSTFLRFLCRATQLL